MRNIWVNSLILLPLISMGCKNELSGNDYIQYLSSEENGLSVVQRVNNLQYRAQLLTNDWYKLTLTKRGDYEENSVYIQEDEIHLVFSVSTQTNENPISKGLNEGEDYFRRVQRINQDLPYLLYIEQNNESTLCSFAMAEANYDLSPKLNFTVVFSKIDPTESFTIIFDDAIWGSGPVRFYFDKKNLNKLPKLK